MNAGARLHDAIALMTFSPAASRRIALITDATPAAGFASSYSDHGTQQLALASQRVDPGGRDHVRIYNTRAYSHSEPILG